MKFWFTYFLLSIAAAAVAQPGYLGKKFSIGYGIDAFPWIGSFTEAQEYTSLESRDRGSDKEKLMVMTIGQHAHAGWVFNRKMEAFADVGIRKSTIFLSEYQHYPSFIPNELSARGLFFNTDIGFRYYFRDFVSPIGFYHQLSLGFIQMKYDKGERVIKGVDNFQGIAKEEVAPKIDDAEIKLGRLSYGIGLKKILFRSVYFQSDLLVHFYSKKLYTSILSSRPDGKTLDGYDLGMLIVNFNSIKRFDLKMGIGLMF
jgi:hypothetical protein